VDSSLKTQASRLPNPDAAAMRQQGIVTTPHRGRHVQAQFSVARTLWADSEAVTRPVSAMTLHSLPVLN
jgi:hypothetical protein